MYSICDVCDLPHTFFSKCCIFCTALQIHCITVNCGLYFLVPVSQQLQNRWWFYFDAYSLSPEDEPSWFYSPPQTPPSTSIQKALKSQDCHVFMNTFVLSRGPTSCILEDPFFYAPPSGKLWHNTNTLPWPLLNTFIPPWGYFICETCWMYLLNHSLNPKNPFIHHVLFDLFPSLYIILLYFGYFIIFHSLYFYLLDF